jgi:thiol-disulfide isomerase/thioredoxin
MSLSGWLWIVGVMALTAFPVRSAELTAVPASYLPKSPDHRLHALIQSHAGRPVLINFWATWCEPCREEMPSLQRLANSGRDRGLVVITVAVADNLRHVEGFLREYDVSLPVIDDREQAISRAWGARVVPTTLVLDRRHRIRLRGVGQIDWDSPAIHQQLYPLYK